jgi:hypothetical protein
MLAQQMSILAKSGQQGRVERGTAVCVFAVEEELRKDNAGQQVVDRVLVEALIVEPFPDDRQLLQQNAVGTAVAPESIWKPTIKVARRQTHPMEGMGGLVGRSEGHLQIESSVFDFSFIRKQLRVILGTYAATPGSDQMRLDGDQERSAGKIPREFVRQRAHLRVNRPIELTDDSDGRFGIGGVGILGEQTDPDSVAIAEEPFEGFSYLFVCQSLQDARACTGRTQYVVRRRPIHTLSERVERHAMISRIPNAGELGFERRYSLGEKTERNLGN